jgi:predicted hydrocarbon binding protein
MDRKDFLKRAGLCCVSALVAGPSALSGQEASAQLPVTACDKKVKQGQAVIRRLMRQMEQDLDRNTSEKIMESCGRACYQGAHGERKEPPAPEQVEAFLSRMREYLGEDCVEQLPNETRIHFRYKGNPQGLKVADGYCLCPILEDAPKDIPGLFCHCSVGYVGEIFERNLGKPVRVELQESVLMGSKTCSFLVRVTEKQG